MQFGIYCLFPLILTFEKNPQTRRVSFYVYISLVLLMGGFLGAVYHANLPGEVYISGGTLAYGGFIMAGVLMAFIENDAFILRNIIRLVAMVGVFKVALFTSIAQTLVSSEVGNPLNTPAALFEISIPLIAIGAVLIIIELYTLFFMFDRLKSRLSNYALLSAAYSLCFVFVIIADGVLFPLLALDMSGEVFTLIIGNLSGKVVIALSFGLFLFCFMLTNKTRMKKALSDPLVDWRLLLSSSSKIVATLESNEQQLRQAKTVFEQSREGIAVLNKHYCIINTNKAFQTLFNEQQPSDLHNQNLLDLFELHARQDAIDEHLKKSSSWTDEVAWRDNDKLQYGLLTLVVVENRHQGLTTYTATLTNISELVEAREELRHLAHHDVLTNLPNRRALQIELESAQSSLRNDATIYALLLIDLDNFKQINDSLGHSIGDKLLIQISRRLSPVLPPQARLFRIGGDEFSLFYKQPAEAASVIQLANAIRLQLSYPYDIGSSVPVYIDCCIGISWYPNHAQSLAELYQQADTALYWAKGLGKGTVKVYQSVMTESRLSTLTMESALRDAIKAGQIKAYLQPKVDIRHGRVVGAEVLARWIMPDGQSISPDIFIALAEDTGLIEPLTQSIMLSACEALQQIKPLVTSSFKLAVNISARQLINDNLCADLKAIIDGSNLSANHFELELTETALIDVNLGTLATFKLAGFTLALDDFGTGYSSLSYLNKLPVDTLKIDKSFITSIPGEPSSCNLTRSIIKIADDLGCDVVAEGVETAQQLQFLVDEKCAYAQGFLYSKPLPITEFVDYLRANQQRNKKGSQ
ncbi:GGDEF and EAL domain-containing protein [Alteromonas gilva]|uniref:EAL domain-containing protein n=1 Tax=Alteromonas gilva TaxID=2987522 RepID=A0ABT5L6U7_9ALTE|nr:GGDEF and EAL domain-containing protein [Alteromonas gilva]MDC8832789.1 EAL domain-containing protein [Alteromonas gilva]